MSKRIDIDLLDSGGDSVYVSERKVYPRDVSGRFDRLRKAAVFWLLGMYYVFPWVKWDGRQAVLFDLPARKFYVFGLVFWPQDFLFLAMLLIIAAMALFFFTSLAGRLWCGYACPQTVWTEVFLWMERWTEGDRGKRMKLDAGPWNRDKILRKGAKHALWALFALWTGFTFVGFFTPITDLTSRLVPFAWGGWETFWVLFYALATWGNAGFLREQVCKYMCPYARFQSAMFDRNTLIIAYDPMRGEPRGPRKRGLGSVLERARGLIAANPAAVSDTERGEVRQLLVNARLYRMLAAARAAYQQQDWELAIKEYEQALTLLAERHPEVQVEITQREVTSAYEGLLAHDFDLLLGEEYPGVPEPHRAGVHREDFTTDALRLAMPTTGPFAELESDIGALSGASWAVDPESSTTGRWERSTCRAAGFEAIVRFETTDPLLHAHLVRTGHAVSFMSEIIAAQHLAGMRLVAWNGRYQHLFDYPDGMLYVGRPVADLIRYNAERGELGEGDIEVQINRRIGYMRAGSPHVFERTRSDGKVIEDARSYK